MNPSVVLFLLALLLCCMPAGSEAGITPLPSEVADVPGLLFQSYPSFNDSSPAKLEEIQNQLALCPNSWSTRLRVGVMYEQLGLLNMACQEYEKAVHLATGKKQGTMVPLQNMVRFKLRMRDSEGAHHWAEVGLKQFPQEPAVWELKVRLLMGQLAMTEAQKLADKATRLFPDRPVFWQLNILTLMTQLDSAKVDVCLRQALKNFPQSAEIYSVYGLVLLSRSKARQALAAFNTAINLDNSCWGAYLLKLRALEQLGHTAEMQQCYRHLFAKMPLDLPFTKSYIESLIAQKQYMDILEPALVLLVATAKSTPFQTTAIRQDPDLVRRARLIVSVALICMPSSKADKLINQAANHFVDAAWRSQVHCLAGSIYYQLGRCQLAAQQYRKALSLLPATRQMHLNLAQYLENQLLDYEGALVEYRQLHPLKRQDMHIGNHVQRLSKRLGNRSNDAAWQLKDMVRLYLGRNPVVGALRLMVAN